MSIDLNFFFPFLDIRYFFSSLKLQHCQTIALLNKLMPLKKPVPQPRTEFYKRSLSYSGSVLWNGLPLEVRQLTSPSIFKGKLRDINFD